MPETTPQSAPETGGTPGKESRPAGNGAAEFGAGAEALNYPQSNANENDSQQEKRASSGTAAAKPVTSPQKKLSSAVPAFERKVLTDQPVSRFSRMTRRGIIGDVTSRAIEQWKLSDAGHESARAKEQELVCLTNRAFKHRGVEFIEKKDASQGDYKPLLELTDWQAAELLSAFPGIVDDEGFDFVGQYGERVGSAAIARIVAQKHVIVRIELAAGIERLGVYQDSGEDEGIHSIEASALTAAVRSVMPGAKRYFVAEVADALATLDGLVPKRTITREAHLSIPVANGVYNRRTRRLEPHSPERVFVWKSPVAYDPTAECPVIVNPDDGTTWSADELVTSMTDDAEVQEVLWQLFCAAVFPNHPWNKAGFLYSALGNNGKGTLLRAIRGIVGSRNTWNGDLQALCAQFLPGRVMTVQHAIADENDVGARVESLSTLKSVLTEDAWSLEAKHQDPVDMNHRMYVLQCINELPQVRDRSDSWARRGVFIPCTAHFEGNERRYIKSDYVGREDVQCYYLRRALECDAQEFSEPQACLDLKAEMVRENDSVRAFWHEFESQFVWDGLPWGFVYDLYRKWFGEEYPGSKPPSSKEFRKSLRIEVAKSSTWDDGGRNGSTTGARFRASSHCKVHEPLSHRCYRDRDEADLGLGSKWTYDRLAEDQRGIVRIGASAAGGGPSGSGGGNAPAPGPADDGALDGTADGAAEDCVEDVPLSSEDLAAAGSAYLALPVQEQSHRVLTGQPREAEFDRRVREIGSAMRGEREQKRAEAEALLAVIDYPRTPLPEAPPSGPQPTVTAAGDESPPQPSLVGADDLAALAARGFRVVARPGRTQEHESNERS
ncbi:DNA primase family protein [Leucobacter luti]|uniref:P4 family phage/plasmid primase-like protein n=1 Tax=Leucobacter luti TaxID=340320 RepID=A0A4V6MD05_9MICO|nr:phage/plasmid primase, P4 family [Leucobacter luti]MBL3699008.1 hypothetical protein [Leucobacter luti]RZT66389.1 P4 family phage/plasmid primase-like protein [Leucobacter luti]